uniref:NmrA-like domain-containing protein n=1 Tax=Mycena chlorophos TaxID=658473 RepID=A0ABQ0L7E0_MYCCL|nr:predicted protein [Mycena chlorophos]
MNREQHFSAGDPGSTLVCGASANTQLVFFPMASSDSEVKARGIIVMLATGKQGSAVVRALAKANAEALAASQPMPWFILAQTRNPPSGTPQPNTIFALPGVHGLQGDPTRPHALFEEENLPPDTPLPVYGVFSAQQSADNVKGVEGEVVEGKALADAARMYGIQHFVHSSVQFGSAKDRKSIVPHFESKRQIEEYIERTHPILPTTILRPVTFMDQLVIPELAHAQDPSKPTSSIASRLARLIFANQLKPSTHQQFIAVSDIGAVAALAFAHPDVYLNPKRAEDGSYLGADGRFKEVDLAGDQLSPLELETVWREVFAGNTQGFDEELRYRGFWLPLAAKLVGNGMKEVRLMFQWFNDSGFTTDIPALRAAYPGLKDFRTFLEQEVLLQVPDTESS